MATRKVIVKFDTGESEVFENVLDKKPDDLQYDNGLFTFRINDSAGGSPTEITIPWPRIRKIVLTSKRNIKEFVK